MTLLTVGILPEVRLLAHMVALFLISWRTSIQFSRVTAPVYIPTNSAQGFPFSHFFKNTCSLFDFLIITILTKMRWHLIVVLICISQMIRNVELFYSCTCWLFVCLIWEKKMFTYVLCLFFCCYWVIWFSCIFGC